MCVCVYEYMDGNACMQVHARLVGWLAGWLTGCMHVCIYMHLCMFVCMHVCISLCMCVCVCICIVWILCMNVTCVHDLYSTVYVCVRACVQCGTSITSHGSDHSRNCQGRVF